MKNCITTFHFYKIVIINFIHAYDAFIYIKLFDNDEIFSNVFKHYDFIKN